VSCGGVVEFLPRSWWQRAIDRAIDFVVMDIGVIYVELFGAIMIVIAGVTTLIILARRRTRSSVSSFLLYKRSVILLE